MNTKYTAEEIELEAKLSAAAHTTLSVSEAFSAITGKDYDTDYFCNLQKKGTKNHETTKRIHIP
jgi:hypothetical protein